MFLLISAAVLLAAIQTGATPTPPDEGDDILVIGERLKHLRAITKSDRKTGVRRCIVKKSSGDRALDSSVCDALLSCAKVARVKAEMEACLAPRMAGLVGPRSNGRGQRDTAAQPSPALEGK